MVQYYSYLKPRFKNIEKNFQWLDFLQKGIPVMMGLFVFLNPFPHITAIKEFVFYPTVFAAIVLFFFKKIELSFKTPLTLPFALFVFWAFLNLFFALDKANSIHDFFAHLLKYLLFYYVLINYFSSPKRLLVLSWIVIVSSTIFSAATLTFFYVILKNPLSTRFGITFTDSATNIIGFTTVFALILSLQHFYSEKTSYLKVISLFCFLLLYVASVLTQARGTLIALILSLFVLLAKNKKALLCFSGPVLLYILISPVKDRFANYDFYHVRLGLFYYSVEIIKSYPIIGSGFSIDTYRDTRWFDPKEYMARIPEKYRTQPHGFYWSHNMLLDIGVRVGLVGLALFLYVLFVPVKMCWRLIWYAEDDFIKSWGLCMLSAFVMFCVKGLFDPVFTHFVDVIFYTILSMITILWRLNEEEPCLV
jgi:hypothetical protein